MTMCTFTPPRVRRDDQVERLDFAAINLSLCVAFAAFAAGPGPAAVAAWRTGVILLIPASIVHRTLRTRGHRPRETALLTAWSQALVGMILIAAVGMLVPLGFLLAWALFALGTEPILGAFGTFQLLSVLVVLWSLQRAAYRRNTPSSQGDTPC
jgi:hypothetical protein